MRLMAKNIRYFRVITTYIFIALTFFQQAALAQWINLRTRNTGIIRQYTTDNGLPSNAIVGLAWEPEGHVILATEAGLIRFDGTAFYDDTLSTKPFFKLLRNYEGKLIAFARNGGLYEIEDGSVCPYFSIPFYQHNKKSLNRFALVRMPGRRFFEEAQKDNSPFYWTNNSSIYPVTEHIVIENLDKVFNICDIKNDHHLFTIKKTGFENPLLIYLEGKPHLAYSNGELHEIDVKNKTLIKKLVYNLPILKEKEKFRILHEYGQRHPIFTLGKNAWKLRKLSDGNYTFEPIADCLPENVLLMHAEYVDEIQTLFIGTESNGLLVIKYNPFEQLLPKINTNNLGTSYYLQLPIGDGRIMTNYGVLLGESNGNPILEPEVSNDLGHSWYKDSNGDLWYSRLDSVFHYSSQKRKNYLLHREETLAPEKTVFTGRRDTVFFANVNGLYIIQNDSIRKFASYSSPFNHKPYPDDIEYYQDKLLISTCNGLYEVNIQTGKMKRLFYIPEVCIRDIFIHKQTLLLATYGDGLYRMQNNTIEKLPIDKEHFLAFAHCFINDGKGNLWISSNRGIFRAKLKTLADLETKAIHYDSYEYYGLTDGLKATELNGGCKPCGLKIGDKISFPSMNGLIQFNPQTVQKPQAHYPLRIEKVYIDNEIYRWEKGKPIIIEEGKENLRIEISQSWWSNTHNLHIDYQLMGFRPYKQRLKYPEEQNIIYSRLPSGDFKLVIRRLDRSGDSEIIETLSIPIIVRHPWYREWWGLLILTVAGALLLAIVIYLRLQTVERQKRKLSRIIGEQTRELKNKNKQLGGSVDKMRRSQMILEENNRMKNHVIAILSHDLVTPLRFISQAGRKLLEHPENYDRQAILDIIVNMVNTIQHLEILSSNILNWIKYFRTNRSLIVRSFDLHELVNRQQEPLQMFFKNKDNKFHNHIPENTFVTQHPDPIGVIIFNLISNANKYTHSGDISVDYEDQGSHFVIYVSDTGSGIPKEKINKILKGDPIESSPDTDMQKGNGLGYMIIRELISLMKGELTIESEPGNGTTIIIRLQHLI
jgi:signal transduction histidine kinase